MNNKIEFATEENIKVKLFLVNYRHIDSEPCKSITNLSLEEAINLAGRLHNNSSCKAHRRFGSDFVRYYKDRKKAEQFLYDGFQKLGGIPRVKYPLYFTLQDFEGFSANFDEHREIKLDLNEIAESDVSFTLGDSMALYYKGELNRVFTKSELLKQLELKNNNVAELLNSIGEQCGFIEAQLWNYKYCRK